VFTRWIERVFDDRYKYLRLTLLALSAMTAPPWPTSGRQRAILAKVEASHLVPSATSAGRDPA
jgi:hypothetical protein